jgi:hypothetical protein
MYTNQVSIESFQGRTLHFLMGADRIFLFRELFVALALILAVTGLVFAQHPTDHRKPANSISSQSATVAAASISPAVSKEKIVVGETKPQGNGQVRSWVSLDASGNPTAIGLTFTEAALSGLPAEPPPGAEGTELSLNFPAQAGAFKHVMLNWNPHGHPPAKVYDVGHFDFHFYTITEAERVGITAKGDDLVKAKKEPAKEFVPEGYIHIPDSEIPRMGSHWVNPLSKELQGSAFTTTFLYGSYDGNMIFAEPMIAKSFLETKTNVTERIKLPAKYARNAYYPTSYSVKYDPVTREYTVALEGMTLR